MKKVRPDLCATTFNIDYDNVLGAGQHGMMVPVLGTGVFNSDGTFSLTTHAVVS